LYLPFRDPITKMNNDTQKMQTEVVRRLDEIIKELENQKKGS